MPSDHDGLEPLVDLAGVSKTYRLQHETSLKALRRSRDRRPKYHQALTDVSLVCRPGEVIGLIGPNGAGKSTLLKLLSRVTVPDHGRIAINGRVASLLEVGAGFHPELTGRENIHLNGAILGMTPAAIEERFDAIVDFANVAKFLDTPVKRFSSGMRVRLAIAVALHLDSDIVILDEVLAVGDTNFQQRCLGLLEGMAKRGTKATIVVSHNMQTIASICSRAILLEAGSVAYDGDVDTAIEKYFQAVTRTTATDGLLAQRTNAKGDGHPLLIDVAWSHGNPGRFVCGGPWSYDVSVDHDRLEPGSTLRTSISADGGTVLAQSTHPLERMEGEASTFTVTLPQLPLLPGRYLLGLGLEGPDGVMADEVHGALSFDVLDPTQTSGDGWAAVAANPGVLLPTEITGSTLAGAPQPVG